MLPLSSRLGLTASLKDGQSPTQKQWARIKERVAEIDGKAVTHRLR